MKRKENENLEIQKEEKMKDRVLKIALIIVLVITSNVFALDNKIDNYFDGLNPNMHINHFSDRKDKLPTDTINFDDIEEFIHYYNPEVLSDWNSWENNKSANDVYNDYIDAADRLYDSAAGQDSELQEGMAYAQADAMRIQADKNVNDSYVNFLSYYLKEKQLVLATKVLDLNYQKYAYELMNAEASIEEAKRKEESAENSLKFGSGTEIDYLTAKKAVVDANSNLISVTSSQKNYKRNTLINCGKAYDEEIYLSPINLEEDFDISSINLNNDFEYAKKHNIQFEIYKRKRENARTDEVKKEYDILINAAPQNIYNDLETKYSNLIDLIDSRYNREIAFNLANSNYAKATNEFKSGKISKKEFDTSLYNMRVALHNLEIVKYDFKIALENYRASVKGFGNA